MLLNSFTFAPCWGLAWTLRRNQGDLAQCTSSIVPLHNWEVCGFGFSKVYYRFPVGYNKLFFWSGIELAFLEFHQRHLHTSVFISGLNSCKVENKQTSTENTREAVMLAFSSRERCGNYCTVLGDGQSWSAISVNRPEFQSWALQWLPEVTSAGWLPLRSSSLLNSKRPSVGLQPWSGLDPFMLVCPCFVSRLWKPLSERNGRYFRGSVSIAMTAKLVTDCFSLPCSSLASYIGCAEV